MLTNNAVKFQYHAGQYVNIILPIDKPESRPFSIANAPDQKTIEFHIRHVPENAYIQQLIKCIKTNQTVYLTGPYGLLRYRSQPKLPLLFLAAGTGFAPCKAIIEQALQDSEHAPIYLYWGARKMSDLYLHESLLQKQTETKNFFYFPVLSDLSTCQKNRVYRVYHEILKHHADISKMFIYASGPAEMVFASKDFLNAHYYQQLNFFYSDWTD